MIKKHEGKQAFDEATGEFVLKGLDKMSKARTLQFNNQMWKSQIDKTSIAFSSDELNEIIKIYQRYENIYKKYIELQKLSFGMINDPKEAWKAEPIYKELIQDIPNVLEINNPIRKS